MTHAILNYIIAACLNQGVFDSNDENIIQKIKGIKPQGKP